MPVARRVVLVLLVACAGSALFASPSAAGPVNARTGLLTAAVYNATPYTWTLVDPGRRYDQNGQNPSPQRDPCGHYRAWRRNQFQLNANYNLYCLGDYEYGYDGYFTYRVDVVGGPSEYVTVAIWGGWPHLQPTATSIRCGVPPPRSTSRPGAAGTGLPAGSWGAAGARDPNPQITFAHNGPTI